MSASLNYSITRYPLLPIVILLLVLASCKTTEKVPEEIPKEEKRPEGMDVVTYSAKQRVELYLDELRNDPDSGTVGPELHRNARIQQFEIYDEEKVVSISFNESFSYIPFRPKTISSFKNGLYNALGEPYNNYSLRLTSMNRPISSFIPNYYRKVYNIDYSRMPYENEFRPVPLIRETDRPYHPVRGLNDKYIGVWHSHGWYYNNDRDRWEWQRPRLFQTVEDLLVMGFTRPFLYPMLENAGATLFVPRERDIRDEEIIIDNDKMWGEVGQSSFNITAPTQTGNWQRGRLDGFSIGNPPYKNNYNPFSGGSYLQTRTTAEGNGNIEYRIDVPETGRYAVYLSYKSLENSTSDAHYVVHHAGGQTEYRINQRIGGGTWIYLDQFSFRKGSPADSSKIVLSNQSQNTGDLVTADAVKVGGGEGTIARGGRTSGRARFIESARYFMQYAGVPDSVYNIHDGKDDYTDDYQSRGEWINYLMGGYDSESDRVHIYKDGKHQGLGIPIDLSLALHTDAGVTESDSTVGTLSIYSLESHDGDTLLPSDQSRMASRDLSDIVQTQIVADIRHNLDSTWSRRAIYEAGYSEAYRPDVPALLLEILSHQNFADMKYAMDPRFRFMVSRSIYKGVLKYLATEDRTDYVVQPLPVTNLQLLKRDDQSFHLKWEPQEDPTEPTATPTKYVVYTRKNNQAFGNGRVVEEPNFTLMDPEPGVLYSFKVTAVNEGGESFPSEILSAANATNSKGTVMVVNAFDRIAAPATVDEPDFKGFANFNDEGVPYKYDLSFTGDQINFNPDQPWTTNDKPGFGASGSSYETQIIAGNTFDYPVDHARSIIKAGYSVVSVSDESVMQREVDISQYNIVDVILGEEKTTYWKNGNAMGGGSFRAFPARFIEELTRFLEHDGKLFISGAYPATELFGASNTNRVADSLGVQFAEKWLKINLGAGQAVKTGETFVSSNQLSKEPFEFRFNTDFDEEYYKVEAPDAIDPIHDDTSTVMLRYKENRFSAAVGYRQNKKTGPGYGVFIMGFPFETILNSQDRDQLMRYILDYLD